MAKAIAVGVLTDAQGAHLDAYFTALAKTEEAESVLLSDPSGATVERAKKALGSKLKDVFRAPGDLLKKQPALALVSLPAVQSPPAIELALEAGCHVFAEKPACVRAADFERLTTKAERKHLHLMLALANRSHAPVRKAREIVRAGKLGRIYAVEAHIVADQTRLKSPNYHKAWYAQKSQAGGGHLIWLGIHWLDLVQLITGLKVAQVAGFAGVVGGQPIDVEDSAAVALRFDNGCFGTMTSGYYLDKGYHSHIKVWGEHGWLRLASIEDEPLEWYSTRDVKEPKVEKFAYGKGERGYTPFVRSAVRACAGLEEAPISGAECLHVLKTIFAFYEAVKTGRAQTV